MGKHDADTHYVPCLPPVLMTARHERDGSPSSQRRKLEAGELLPGSPLRCFSFPLRPPASLASFLRLAGGFVFCCGGFGFIASPQMRQGETEMKPTGPSLPAAHPRGQQGKRLG